MRVNLTGVSFLASVALRSSIQSAKALDLKGGRKPLLVDNHSAFAGALEDDGTLLLWRLP